MQLVQKKHDEIYALRIINSCDKEELIKAKHFVLACGGIEIPRILFNSDQFFTNGIGNRNNLLGRYFSTHPKGNVVIIKLKKRVSNQSPF